MANQKNKNKGLGKFTQADMKEFQQTGKMSFTVEAKKPMFERFNAFQGGTGYQGGTVKAQNKRDRKNGKSECRKALREY